LTAASAEGRTGSSHSRRNIHSIVGEAPPGCAASARRHGKTMSIADRCRIGIEMKAAILARDKSRLI
jgi:hypothetical protein